MRRRNLGLGLILAALAAICLLLAATQRIEQVDFDQHRPDDAPPPSLLLKGGGDSSVGQSFHTRRAVTAISLRVGDPSATASGALRFILREDGPDGRLINDLPVNTIDESRLYLPVSELAAGRDYYFALSGPADSLRQLAISHYPADAYSGGTLFVDGVAQAGDLSVRFLSSYSLLQGLGDAAAGLLGNLWLALCALLLYFLPGRAILSLVPPGTLNAAQRWLAAPAVTLAALPLLLLWLQPTPLRFGGWQMWAILVLAAAVCVWDERRRWHSDGWPQVQGLTTYATLIGVLGVGLLVRLLTSYPMQAGSGIDGYHHTLISQMILERGQLPTDYQPYAPLASFTYHYGFHASTAALSWLSAADTVRLTLITGQLLSVAVAASVFVFVEVLFQRRSMALFAAFIITCLAIFPAFYVNWSRYTQLAGLTLLPIALTLLVLAARHQPRRNHSSGISGGVMNAAAVVGNHSPEASGGAMNAAANRQLSADRWPLFALAALTSGALFTVHYRIWILYATFAAIYALSLLIFPAQSAERLAVEAESVASWRGWVRQRLPFVSVAGVGLAGVLLALPWAINLQRNFTVRVLNQTDGSNRDFFNLVTLIGDQPLRYYSTWPLLALALVGVAVLLLRLDRWGWIIALWVGLHVLLSNPYWLRLPFAGLVDNVTLVQCSFIPVAIFAGATLGWLLDYGWAALRGRLDEAGRRIAVAGGAAVLLMTGLAGAMPQLTILDVKPYVAAQDVAAMRWIAQNTPVDSRFLVSDFGFTWANNLAQGSDSGLWLPLFTRLADPTTTSPPTVVRLSTAPPQPSYNEQIADPSYLPMTVDTTLAVVDLNNAEGLDDPRAIAAWQTLQSYGITHIFVGSRGGVVDPLVLARYPQAVLIHQVDDVWVYRVAYEQTR